MDTVTRIVRTAFLLAAFVAYAQPSYAADFDVSCTPGCNANVRTLDCTFVDDDYGGVSSVCNGEWSCYMGSCCQPLGQTAVNAHAAMWDECYDMSVDEGGDYPWFVMSSCDDMTEYNECNGSSPNWYVHAAGTFYCSYQLASCS